MRKLFKKERKECYYCKEKTATQIKFFDFPIDCVCCLTNHEMQVHYCNKCEPVEPKMIAVILRTEKVLDPIHEQLFIKVS
jgi:hypothetical protein